MTDYLTEQEQVELLKKWIKQYSLFILAGVLIAAIAISGWRYWQQRQNKTYQHASSIFDEMVALRAQQDQDTTSTFQQANKLFSHYSQTAYGEFAALMLARNQVIKKDYPAAEKQLHWVLDHSHISSLKQIARLRLARLLSAEQKPQDALTLLNTTDDKTFNGMIDETKGDAYLSLKNTPMARQWYQQALTDLPNAEVLRPLLQMKYDNLVIYQ